MTTPAVVETTPDAPLNHVDAMEHTIRATMAETVPPVAPSAERPRDPATGKFLPADLAQAASADAPEAPAADAPVVEEAVAPVIPDGYVAAAALPEDKARGFTVRDAEGEIVPPDLTWELNANGKPRTLTTDKLVAYAQMGVYNHEREQAFEQAQVQTQQTQARMQQIEQAYQQQAQYIERLLTDPNALVQAIHEFEAKNTPEARAQREREQLEQERSQFQFQRMAQQSEQFVNGNLAPALDMIQQANPLVSNEELAARVLLASDRYRVQAGDSVILHPNGYDAIRQYVASDLFLWAQQLNEHRAAEQAKPQAEVAKVKADAKNDIEKMQAKAQRAKRTATAVTRPVGGVAPAARPVTPNVKSQRDVADFVIGRSLDAVRTG